MIRPVTPASLPGPPGRGSACAAVLVDVVGPRLVAAGLASLLREAIAAGTLAIPGEPSGAVPEVREAGETFDPLSLTRRSCCVVLRTARAPAVRRDPRPGGAALLRIIVQAQQPSTPPVPSQVASLDGDVSPAAFLAAVRQALATAQAVVDPVSPPQPVSSPGPPTRVAARASLPPPDHGLAGAFGGEGSGPLSRRQGEIAKLAAQGLSNQEIADTLFIDITTVKTHLGDVFRRLQIRRRSQIAPVLSCWDHPGGQGG